MQIGSASVLVTGELALQHGLDVEQAEELMLRIDAAVTQAVPEVRDTFWELHHEPLNPPEQPGPSLQP
jgi:hypothetical protein